MGLCGHAQLGATFSKNYKNKIEEIKNEIGSGGTQPHAQGISYYIHSTKSSVAERSGFRFPCILIMLFGKLTVFRCLQPLQVPIWTSWLLFGALIRMYRCFHLPCPSFSIAQIPQCT
jgi:hypothetical protein